MRHRKKQTYKTEHPTIKEISIGDKFIIEYSTVYGQTIKNVYKFEYADFRGNLFSNNHNYCFRNTKNSLYLWINASLTEVLSDKKITNMIKILSLKEKIHLL